MATGRSANGLESRSVVRRQRLGIGRWTLEAGSVLTRILLGSSHDLGKENTVAIDVNNVATLDDGLFFSDTEKLLRLTRLAIVSLNAQIRLEPNVQSEVVHLLQKPPTHIADSRLTWSNHLVGKRALR